MRILIAEDETIIRLDLRDLLPRIAVPVLHLVTPDAVAHHRGHDAHLAATIPAIETVELPGPDELWWLDRSGTAVEATRRFLVDLFPTPP